MGQAEATNKEPERARVAHLEEQRIDHERLQQRAVLELLRSHEPLAGAMGLRRAKDMGGHGGTYLADITLKNEHTHHVFLKPLDPTEERNYRIICDLAPELSAFMPSFYGTVEIAHKRFMAMQNVNYGPAGESLSPLVDIKLAGQLNREHFHPIADQKEMLATRDQKKGWFDYQQMALGAHSSPHYMIVQSDFQLARIFLYKDSESYLLKVLEGSLRADLSRLAHQLARLERALEQSQLAFIGASILLVKSPLGPIKPILVDPAHMQVDPCMRARTLPSLESFELQHIYYGDESSFADRKESNRIALKAIRATIAKAGG